MNREYKKDAIYKSIRCDNFTIWWYDGKNFVLIDNGAGFNPLKLNHKICYHDALDNFYKEIDSTKYKKLIKKLKAKFL